ncbi:MAG TPA: hypothetical protein VN643_13460 [Pyrinomonadaceae bacterium]|nr:hypothetical protein [Pyrinomonadaceae bacterium]
MKILWALSLAFMTILVPLVRIGQAGQAIESDQAAKTKAEITRRIANGKTKVKLKLRNGSEIKGRLINGGESEFTLSTDKSGQQNQIAYSDVERVKGRGLSTGAKIGIIGGILVGAAVIVVAVGMHDFNPFRGPILR